MKKFTFLTVSALLASSIIVSAQDTTKTKQEAPFVPSGKIGVTVLTNASTQIQGEEVTGVGYTMERTYIGYTFKATKELSGEVRLDVGSNEDLLDSAKKTYTDASIKNRFMYLKYSYGQYEINNTKIRFGMLPVQGYILQENMWGNRYAYKTFMDVNKYAKSSDLGVEINQTIDENLSVDFSITNGEGFNNVQADKDFVYSIGSTFKPTDKITIRAFGDYSNLHNTPVTLAGFIGIKPNDDFSICGEYNHKLNHEGKENNDLSGFSIYTTYSVTPKVKVFARFDDITSNTLDGATTPWNDKSNGSTAIGGLEYSPTKGLRLAASYNTFMYENTTKDTKHIVGIFAEIKF